MYNPIEDYGMISNGRSAALISREGSLDWLCWPRFDSPALFFSLLDDTSGGYWHVELPDMTVAERRYLKNTNILQTTYQGAGSKVVVHDFMSLDDESHSGDYIMPEEEIIRMVQCTEGEALVRTRIVPRPYWGRKKLTWRHFDSSMCWSSLNEGLLLCATEPIHFEDGVLFHETSLKKNDEVCYSLSLVFDAPAVFPVLPDYAHTVLQETTSIWRQWAAQCQIDGEYADLVKRSALTLKMLSYIPSGAIIAAPTTSLPERLGGDLNWDYRYCWLRDSSLAIDSLINIGFVEEAREYLSWLLHTTRLTRPRVAVLYDVYGRRPTAEKSIDSLRGYKDSQPVRTGNAAVQQTQIDVYGEIILAAMHILDKVKELDKETVTLLNDLAHFIVKNWQQVGNSLWEDREKKYRFTSSVIFCYGALKSLTSAKSQERKICHKPEIYQNTLEQMKDFVESSCWNEEIQSYVQFPGSMDVDASLILMGRYGFLPMEDPKLRATYERIRATLSAGPGLYYRNKDLKEGAFAACTLWCVEYLAAGGGSLEEAKELLDNFLSFQNELGLFSEEIDPETGQMLGNYPLAFTHFGLIQAVLAIEKRSRQQKRGV